MTWNYRVMRFEAVEGLAAITVDEDYYGIVEVHYATDGRLSAYMETPVRMQWDEEGDGPKMLEAMVKAFTLPVLTPKDFGG